MRFRTCMSFNSRNLISGLTIALIFGWAGTASAQFAGIIGDTRLKPADVEMATQTAAKLYQRAGVSVGDKATWQNEDTGAVGLVEVTNVDQGGACVTVRHTTQAGTRMRSQSISRRCRQSDGSWALIPE